MQKKRFFQITLGLIGLILVVTGLFAAYFLSNLNRYKGFVVAKLEEVIQRDIEVGDANAVLSFRPVLRLDNVSIANAKWGTQPQMMAVRSIEIGVGILPLLKGEIELDYFILEEPDIFLETDKKGHKNWEFREKKQKPEAGDSDGLLIELSGERKVRIEKGRLRFRNGVSGRTDTLVIHRFVARVDELANRVKFESDGDLNGAPIRAKGTTGAAQSILKNAPFPLDIIVDVEDTRLGVSGKINKPKDFEGLTLDLDMRIKSPEKLSKLAGTDLPALKPLDFSGRLSGNKKTFQLNEIKGHTGKSELAGMLAVELAGKRPKVSGQLTSSLIDLADFLPSPPQGSKQKAASSGGILSQKKQTERVFSDKPLPFKTLRKFDADVSLHIQEFLGKGISMQQVNAISLLKNGRLTLKLVGGKIYEGTATCNLVLNSKASPCKLDSTLKAEKVVLGELLSDFRDKEMLSGGETDLDVTLSSRGDSIQALAAGLNGQILMLSGPGRINNISVGPAAQEMVAQIYRMLNPFTKKDKHTEMKCIVARFDIKDGIATGENGLAFESDKIQILGSGTINLRNEQLEILIGSKNQPAKKTQLFKQAINLITSFKGLSVVSLVEVAGTLAEPKLTLNPKGLLEGGASWGAAIMTGGISILAEGLFNKMKDEGSACEVAREQTSAQP